MTTSCIACVKKALLQLAILACLLETPLVQAQMLSAGYDHTCVIDAGGGVQCWGSNSSGQLGNGSFGDRLVPVRVKSLDSGVIAVAATSPDRSCALRSNGEVLCWGNNARGELGDGTTITRWVPTRVAGLGPGSGVTAITLGIDHACALRADGTVLCWGGNRLGQIGNGASGGIRSPTPVLGFEPDSGVVSISAGNEHTCAVKSDQSVYCWGSNGNHQIGDGTAINRTVQTPVRTLGIGSGAVRVSAGFGYTCVVRDDGAILCWGANWFGQLGNGTTTPAPLPNYVIDPSIGALEMSGLYGHTCARTEAGVVCWGSNNSGELGDGTSIDRSFPVLALGGNIDAVATGVGHSCARKSEGAVVCWGRNFAGQLGNGTHADSLTPQVVNLGGSGFLD